MQKQSVSTDEFWYRYWRYVVHVREKLLAEPDAQSAEAVYWATRTIDTARELLELHDARRNT